MLSSCRVVSLSSEPAGKGIEVEGEEDSTGPEKREVREYCFCLSPSLTHCQAAHAVPVVSSFTLCLYCVCCHFSVSYTPYSLQQNKRAEAIEISAVG
jgi:hypothetical protein